MKKFAITASLALSILMPANCWPGYKKASSSKPVLKDGDDDCIDTNHVHNECGPIRLPNQGHPPGVQYPSAFVMSYDQWNIECPLDAADCQPPFFPNAPEALAGKYPMINGPGFTYYNASYRGGSQVENYTERCVPIFPSYDVNFACTFFIIGDTHTAYLATKGAPKEFGDCCKISESFHAPVRNFSERVNFTGIKDFGPKQKYLGFETYVPTSGGIFSYNFWKDSHYEPYTGETYYVPSFFYFSGVTKGKKEGDDPLPLWVYQNFYNFSVQPFNPEDHFTLPDACNPQAKYCPDFDS